MKVKVIVAKTQVGAVGRVFDCPDKEGQGYIDGGLCVKVEKKKPESVSKPSRSDK